MQNRNQQLLDLADKQLDGTATADEIAQLEALLANQPEAQKEYLRYTMVHGQLGLTTPALPDIRREPKFNADQQRISVATEVASATMPAAEHAASLRASQLLAVIALAAASVAIILWWQPSTESPIAQHVKLRPDSKVDASTTDYDIRELPVQTVGTFGTTATGPTTLQIDSGERQFASQSGADVRVTGPAMFGMSTRDSGVLYSGMVHARLNDPESTFSVLASNLRIVDLGTEFQVTMLDDRHISVKVIDGEVDVQTRTRFPRYHWHFDAAEPETVDSQTSQRNPAVESGTGVTFVDGIVGSGAAAFDNSPKSYVKVLEGAGDKVGTGAMAWSSGVTIEAMFVSHWTAGFRDFDEIFRKEDGVHRILLSFQNDADLNNYDVPAVNDGPCLSFGLHLEQHGYSELDMPLDGRDGRPTLAELTDGKPHHVAATYDSYSGDKSIYIDGQLCFQHRFPVGRLILSGGPSPAHIGNCDSMHHEAFHGIIDEVALYDFALTPEEVSAHYQNASTGKSYFGGATPNSDLAPWGSVTLVSAGTQQVFNKFTGQPRHSVR